MHKTVIQTEADNLDPICDASGESVSVNKFILKCCQKLQQNTQDMAIENELHLCRRGEFTFYYS